MLGHSPAPQIRPVTEADWPAIWPIFDEIVSAGETYIYPRDLTSAQAQQMWLEPPPGLTVVLRAPEGGAQDGPVVLGTAKMGPNMAGPGGHIGTASFMVSAAARGRGVGRALAEYVIDWHHEQGYRGIQFNAVVATNVSAVWLWQDLGFQIVGTVPGAFDHPVHGYVDLHVMYLPLVP